jgi:hypothetical protein
MAKNFNQGARAPPCSGSVTTRCGQTDKGLVDFLRKREHLLVDKCPMRQRSSDSAPLLRKNLQKVNDGRCDK